MKPFTIPLAASILALVAAASPAPAQEFPKPGPELDVLKKMVGDWNATMKFMGGESKGTMVYKMELGGLWLVSSFNGDFGGMKFQGKGLDSYDPARKKYVSVWVDNMITSPLIMEGTYDKKAKTLTMAGSGPGSEGKSTRFKAVTRFGDKTMHFSMFVGDGKEPAFTIVYTRKTRKK